MRRLQSASLAAVTVAMLTASSLVSAATAITNATILTASGERQSETTILIENGVVQAVGQNIPAADDMDVIDAEGRLVTAGFIAASGSLGLVEVGAVRDSVDSGAKHAQLTAGFKLADAFNPQSSLIAIARTDGLTSALIMPDLRNEGEEGAYSRVFAGTAAIADLSGSFSSIRVPEAAVVAYLGDSGQGAAGGSRAAALEGLRAGLDAGRMFADSKDKGSRFSLPESLADAPFSPADVAQLAKVVERQLPLLVVVDKAAEIAQVIRITNQYGIRTVIMGGAEAWQLANELAAADIGVIVNGENNLPLSFDHMGARLDSAAILANAGVELSFNGENVGSHNARNIRQTAGIAVAHGLPWETAVRALSTSAAHLLGFDGDVGRLQSGGVADLVVWDGDPLELQTYPTHVFINGVPQDLSNRQTQLRDRYLEMDTPLPHAYR